MITNEPRAAEAPRELEVLELARGAGVLLRPADAAPVASPARPRRVRRRRLLPADSVPVGMPAP